MRRRRPAFLGGAGGKGTGPKASGVESKGMATAEGSALARDRASARERRERAGDEPAPLSARRLGGGVACSGAGAETTPSVASCAIEAEEPAPALTRERGIGAGAEEEDAATRQPDGEGQEVARGRALPSRGPAWRVRDTSGKGDSMRGGASPPQH